MASSSYAYISLSPTDRDNFRSFFIGAANNQPSQRPSESITAQTLRSFSTTDGSQENTLSRRLDTDDPVSQCNSTNASPSMRRDNLRFERPTVNFANTNHGHYQLNFFDLPAELRSQIYELCLGEECYSINDEESLRELEFPTPMAFGLASARAHHDLKASYNRRTTHILDIRRDLVWLTNWSWRISEGSLSTIRHFYIQGLCCRSGYGNGHAKIHVKLDEQQKQDIVTLESENCVDFEGHLALVREIRDLTPGLHSERYGWNMTTAMLRLLIHVASAAPSQTVDEPGQLAQSDSEQACEGDAMATAPI